MKEVLPESTFHGSFGDGMDPAICKAMKDRCWQCGRRLSQSAVVVEHETPGICGECIADITFEFSLDSTVVNRISLPRDSEELVISLFLS